MKTIIQRINDLANYLDNDDPKRDLAFDIICKLRQSHEEASNSEYTKQELVDLIFTKNNCLATAGTAGLPEEMLNAAKLLQQEIIDAYGFQD